LRLHETDRTGEFDFEPDHDPDFDETIATQPGYNEVGSGEIHTPALCATPLKEGIFHTPSRA